MTIVTQCSFDRCASAHRHIDLGGCLVQLNTCRTRQVYLAFKTSHRPSWILLRRLPMLEAQCASWGGIVSAAVYWPRFVSNLPEHAAEAQQAALDAAKQQLAALHARMETEGELSSLCTELLLTQLQITAPF